MRLLAATIKTKGNMTPSALSSNPNFPLHKYFPSSCINEHRPNNWQAYYISKKIGNYPKTFSRIVHMIFSHMLIISD